MQQTPNMQQMPNMQQAPNMQQTPNMQQAPNMQQMPSYISPEWQQQYMMMGQQMPYPPYAYSYPPMMPPQNASSPAGQQSNVIKQTQAVHVQSAQFPNFTNQAMPGFSAPINNANMGLMMNVPLSVTVEIGKTKRKIRDIMEFSQGTVIELEKQAGAPVDIVVNGQLIARGDVVVIDDNFGVRVTEIVGTKELMDAIDSNA
jgi:flagellar motor switch protein FliN/FliY